MKVTSLRQVDATTALLSLALERSSREPLAHQLYVQIRDHIVAGRLASGARLPSTRRIAEDLGVSRTVALAAYDQLVAEGYLDPRRGSGLYVCRLAGLAASPARLMQIRDDVVAAEPAALNAGQPFDPAAQALDIFPHASWARHLARGWRRGEPGLSGDGEWAGLSSLRSAIARHCHALRGIACGADNVVITAGNADALRLIVRALTPDIVAPGASAWVEDPGFAAARRTLEGEGLRPIAVPVDVDGLDVEAGRRLAEDARLAVVTPSRQFPLGVPLSLSRRLALLGWARQAGAVLIEDEYDSEIRYSGRPLASLMSLDSGGHVVLIGSLSKLMFPGLRLGYIVASQAIVRRLVATRAAEGTVVPTSAQPAMAAFIESGDFAKHLRNLRRELTQRRSVLISTLTERLGDMLVIQPQEAGMHLTATLAPKLRKRVSDIELVRRAAERSLNLRALSDQALSVPAPEGVLLGYAAWTPGEIRAGVDRLAALVAEVDAAA